MGVAVGAPLLILILIIAVVALVVTVAKLQKSKYSLKRRLAERE